jgi:phospholipid/cholesterol/gamma-HCH transport system ATP-binding protein
MGQQEAAVVVEDIHTQFGKQQVHKGISFNLYKGSLTAIIGGSGTGKSVLLREMVGLQRPNSGSVKVLGTDIWAGSETSVSNVKKRFGMMFQDGALFSALSVEQNVMVPLVEHAAIQPALLRPLVNLRLSQAGLSRDVGTKMPSQLSGGMRKRAALARALALEPEILFLDEPTSGLDPTTARSFDRLVRSLVDDLGISVLVVTHDLDTLLTVVDRIIVLADGKMLADGPVQDIVKLDHPWIRSYFAIRTMTE